MKKRFLTFLICLALSLVFPTAAFAEENTAASIKMTPVSNYFMLRAGAEQKYSFKIENTGAKAFSFKVYAAPYNIVDEDYTPGFSEETTYTQITRWVTFKNNDNDEYSTTAMYSVAPGKEVEITYKVNIPENLPAGNQQCVLIAETINNDTLSGTGIKTISRLAHIVVGHGEGETDGTAEITDFKLTGLFSKSGVFASAKVHNKGNIDFSTNYSFKIETIFGKTVYSDENTFTMLPETTRKFASSWENSPLFGVFKVSYIVNANGVVKRSSHLVFIMPIFMLIIALLLLTGIIIWVIMLIRKRKEKKSRLVV